MEIGTIVNGTKIGKRQRDKYIFHACEKCGSTKWVKFIRGKLSRKLCCKCSNPRKISFTWNKYLRIKLSKDDPYYCMVQADGFVRIHRLIVAKSLGRPLKRSEVVHHINGDKQDNRIDNLQLVTVEEHEQITILEERIKFLEKRVTYLERQLIKTYPDVEHCNGGGGNWRS
jgi:hypothetical protein